MRVMSLIPRQIFSNFRSNPLKLYTRYNYFTSSKTLSSTVIKTMNPRDEETKSTNNVYVQHSQGNDMLTITLEYSSNGKSKFFNLHRKEDEPLSATLERLRLSLAKLTKVKKPNKRTVIQEEGDYNFDLRIILDGVALDPIATKTKDAWKDGAILNLNGCPYVVRRNQPQVMALKLPTIMMKGFIILPNVDVANCNVHDCKFRWYRKLIHHEWEPMLQDPELTDRIVLVNSTYWLLVGTGLTYSPNDEDVAHHLKVVCEPFNKANIGPSYSCISDKSVELGPRGCPFEKRHLSTNERFENCSNIRFVTYNILADLYADQDYSRKFLFAHCPAHALDIDYRRQLLLKELHGYNADIVCLQEVDRKEFMKTYEPYFKLVTHHSGVFNTKGGQVSEGVATFFREDRFELVDTHRTILSRLIDPTATSESNVDEPDEAVPTTGAAERCDKYDLSNSNSDSHPILDDLTSEHAQDLLSRYKELRSKMDLNPRLLTRFMGRHTVLQTSLLKFKDEPNKYVIVANTHLYFAPDADHIRLLQGSTCVKYLEYLKSYYSKMIASRPGEAEPKINIIFCGDMNSTPDCGLFKLLHEGKLGKCLKDWQSNEEEAIDGFLIETKLRFSSAYMHIPYTNYTPGFNGCLDYIYYELDGFDCIGTVPLPDHDDVAATGGIPSDVFPSDHLALVAHLKFK